MKGNSGINSSCQGRRQRCPIPVGGKNVGLVWSIVRRFQNRGYEAEDIFQSDA